MWLGLVARAAVPAVGSHGAWEPGLSHSPDWGRTTFLGKRREAPLRGLDQSPEVILTGPQGACLPALGGGGV